MIRKLLRRIIIWALADDAPVTLVNWDINTGRNRFDAIGTTVTGAKDGDDRNIVLGDPYAHSRRVIINTIRRARLNREL